MACDGRGYWSRNFWGGFIRSVGPLQDCGPHCNCLGRDQIHFLLNNPLPRKPLTEGEEMDNFNEDLEKETLAHLHGMQAGVGMKMHKDGGHVDGETSPKHLRVGVNSAMVDHAALLEVLIEKGIVTHGQIQRARIKWAKKEKESYEEYLSKIYGAKVNLV